MKIGEITCMHTDILISDLCGPQFHPVWSLDADRLVDVGGFSVEERQGLVPVDGVLFGFSSCDFTYEALKRNIGSRFSAWYEYGREMVRVLEPDFFIAEDGEVHFEWALEARQHVGDILKREGPGYEIHPRRYRLGGRVATHSVLVGLKEGLGHWDTPKLFSNADALLTAVRDAINGKAPKR